MGPDPRRHTLRDLWSAPRDSPWCGYSLPHMAYRDLRRGVRGADADRSFPGAWPGEPGRREATPRDLRDTALQLPPRVRSTVPPVDSGVLREIRIPRSRRLRSPGFLREPRKTRDRTEPLRGAPK